MGSHGCCRYSPCVAFLVVDAAFSVSVEPSVLNVSGGFGGALARWDGVVGAAAGGSLQPPLPFVFVLPSSSEGFGIAEKIVLLTFISAVILMAILGNLLVMVAVCRDRQLRKIKTNYFIVSLAFADLLVSVLVMPFGAIELVQDNWIYGEMFCLVRTSLDVLLTTASILHLCCISLDRYYAICCQPLVYRNKMTPLRIAVMLGGCWVIPTFISFLPIMQGWNSIGIIDLIQQRQFNKVSNSTYCIFMVNKPYAITCSVVLQRAGAPAEGRQHHPDQHSTHRMKTETKAAKTLCIIMGCFCLCWAPFFITNIIDPFINYTVPGKLWTAFLWLGYINSGLNPFLYAFLNKSFRRAFLIILCCGDERYRRPSILGQTVPCSTTTINGSTHVLRYSVLYNGHHQEHEKLPIHNDPESQESCF
ncbi:PREDICTED: 5-hydroxytryptamine receptor 4 [Tinamus guttatus]|uniref:5-hydroxytryptamine receptor 4 n=1 Tax=Tinamus guttatus TaxID=94827 RepID=UPI00052EE165|nr:PREDICTED: 5-hydroxytryptamine receptor 4 [Tinamus guttatus]